MPDRVFSDLADRAVAWDQFEVAPTVPASGGSISTCRAGSRISIVAQRDSRRVSCALVQILTAEEGKTLEKLQEHQQTGQDAFQEAGEMIRLLRAQLAGIELKEGDAYGRTNPVASRHPGRQRRSDDHCEDGMAQ